MQNNESYDSLYVISKLKRLYPELVITNIATEHNSLYQRAISVSKSQGFKNLADWLKTYGFTYHRINYQQIDITAIQRELKNTFPNGIISNITEKKDLYNKLLVVTRTNEISLKSLLKQWGFEYFRIDESSVDNYCAKRLFQEFNFNGQEIANIAGLSRERIRQIIANPRKTKCSWTNGHFSEDELDLINMMIDDAIFEWKDDDIWVIIRNDTKGNVCIIINNQNEVKCLFNSGIPKELLQKIIDKRMHELTEKDFDMISSSDVKSIMKKPYIYPPKNKRLEFGHLARKRGMTLHEYSKFLNYDGYGPGEANDNTDEKIIKFLAGNTFDGKTYITSDSKNHWIRALASRRGYSIEKFIEFFGYEKATRDFEAESKQKMEFYKQELQKLIKNEGTREIELLSSSNLYRNLYPFAKRRGLSLDELLEELGFLRVNNEDNIDISQNEVINMNLNDIFRRNILEELERMQGTGDIICRNIQQHERNRSLVNKLKELYSGRCQLCKDDTIPRIIKEDGTIYLEAHHITPLANVSMEDEADELDHYKNMIIVCPFHHKVIHYERGGYFQIERKDEEIFLLNKYGNKMKIVINYHL